MPGLIAGFTHVQRGRSAYRGALRVTPKSVPRWTCACAPDHLTAAGAVKCAEAELERRGQGGREVFTLLRCKPCDRWLADGPGPVACPWCSVPLERVKLAVLGRGAAVDPGRRKH
jgi:hypothetical protein